MSLIVFQTKFAEIFSVFIACLSLILNTTIIVIVLKVGRNSPTKKLILGLKLVLTAAILDLTGPVIGIIQEIISVSRSRNVLSIPEVCQILGVIHTIILYNSTNCIAFISLERYFLTHDNPLSIRNLTILGIVQLLPAFLLAFLSAWNGDFKMTNSRMTCSTSPNGGFFGVLLYYLFVLMLVINSVIIIYCYISIINLRSKTKLAQKLTDKSTTSAILTHSSNRSSCLKPYNNESIELVNLCLSSDTTMETTHLDSAKQKLAVEEKSGYNTFALRAFLIMFSYLLILFPCISLLIYEIVFDEKLDYVKSSISVILLFSLTVINPLLLILLHTSISRSFSTSIKSIFDALTNKKHIK